MARARARFKYKDNGRGLRWLTKNHLQCTPGYLTADWRNFFYFSPVRSIVNVITVSNTITKEFRLLNT